jgi:hypothetical protein
MGHSHRVANEHYQMVPDDVFNATAEAATSKLLRATKVLQSAAVHGNQYLSAPDVAPTVPAEIVRSDRDG